jgi:membrane protein YqaA with SNARE-associated domain
MKDENRERKVIDMFISGIFIIAVVAVSILIFCRRDTLVYDDKYGYLSVFVLCFICNATVFAPAPSLIVAVTAAQTLQPLSVILIGAGGTTIGEMVGYFSGKVGRTFIHKDGCITSWVVCHGAIAVFFFALIPFPFFDLAGIASGYSKMKWYTFMLSCFLGKLLKMTVYVLGSIFVKDFFSLSSLNTISKYIPSS